MNGFKFFLKGIVVIALIIVLDPKAAAFLERYLSNPAVLMEALSAIDPSVGRRIREEGTIRGGKSPFREPMMPGEVRTMPYMQDTVRPSLPFV